MAVMFLFVLGLIWITFATFQDLKSKEIANWLNFSLIIFALGFRFFYSLFEANNFMFFYQGLIGLGIFFILGNLFYYGRMFAGGDAKLMMALGAILPFSENFSMNIKIFLLFFILFFFTGACYGLIWSIILGIKHSKKIKFELKKQFKKNKIKIITVSIIGFMLFILGVKESILFSLGILIFILPYLYLFAEAITEICMIKEIKTDNLSEGDWLYRDIKVGNKRIKAKWDGLSKKEIKEIQKKHNKVKIKTGIPFSPVFLISFIILFIMFYFRFLNYFLLV